MNINDDDKEIKKRERKKERERVDFLKKKEIKNFIYGWLVT